MKKLLNITKITFCFLAVGLLNSCSKDSDEVTQPTYDTSILGILNTDPNYSTFAKALVDTGLDKELAVPGFHYNVFAPKNSAFDTYLKSKGLTKLSDVPADQLKQLIANHIVKNTKTVTATSVNNPALATGYSKTLATDPTNSKNLSLYLVTTTNTINGGAANKGAKIEYAGITSNQGLVNLIDNVLELPTVASQINANPDLTKLYGLIADPAQADLLAALKSTAASYTVFAPKNSAITTATTGAGFLVNASADLVTKTLQYHVTSGSILSNALTVNQVIPTITSPVQNLTVTQITAGFKVKDAQTAANIATLVPVDIQAVNGIVHVTDKVFKAN